MAEKRLTKEIAEDVFEGSGVRVTLSMIRSGSAVTSVTV